MSHTPGPWSFRHGDFNTEGDNGHGSITATCEFGPWYIAKIETMPGDEANARLIAAAPDMLAALKAMLPENNDDPINRGRPPFGVCEQARDAIAKAEGR